MKGVFIEVNETVV